MTTPREQQDIMALSWLSPKGPRLSPAAYMRRSGDKNPRATATRILQDAIGRQDAFDIELGLTLLSVFGVTTEHLNLLVSLAAAPWHGHQESIVDLLGDLGDPRAVATLHDIARRPPATPEHQDWWPLARRAIHALGRVGGDEARAAIADLAVSEYPSISAAAMKQLSER